MRTSGIFGKSWKRLLCSQWAGWLFISFKNPWEWCYWQATWRIERKDKIYFVGEKNFHEDKHRDFWTVLARLLCSQWAGWLFISFKNSWLWNCCQAAWRNKRKDNIDRDFSLGGRKRRNFVRPNKKMRDSRLALTNRMEGEGHLWVCTLSQIRPSRNYACWPLNTCETFARKKFQVYYERCTG